MSILEVGGLALLLLVIVAAARGKVRINAREVSDLEARLRPIVGVTAATRASGKAEREEWDDGSAEFEAHVRDLDLPDGSEIEFVVVDVTLGRVVTTGVGRVWSTIHGTETTCRPRRTGSGSWFVMRAPTCSKAPSDPIEARCRG